MNESQHSHLSDLQYHDGSQVTYVPSIPVQPQQAEDRTRTSERESNGLREHVLRQEGGDENVWDARGAPP